MKYPLKTSNYYEFLNM